MFSLLNYFFPENPYLKQEGDNYQPDWETLSKDASFLDQNATPANAKNRAKALNVVRAARTLEKSTTIQSRRVQLSKNVFAETDELDTLNKIQKMTPALITKYNLNVDKSWTDYAMQAAKVVVPIAVVALLFAENSGSVPHNNSWLSYTRNVTQAVNVTDTLTGTTALQNVTSLVTGDTLLGSTLTCAASLFCGVPATLLGGAILTTIIWKCCFSGR